MILPKNPVPSKKIMIDWLIDYSVVVFFGRKGHVAQDRNPGPGYHTLLLR